MSLSPQDKSRPLELAQSAFPAFPRWKTADADDEHDDFCVWGELEIEDGPYRSRRFFVTLSVHQGRWRGHLTIGRHASMWTSADVGDAFLVSTGFCDTVEEGLAALRDEISNLFSAIVRS